MSPSPLAMLAQTSAVRPQSLRLAWWNTHLFPRRGNQEPTQKQWLTASQVVSDLFETLRIDALALGEVTPEALGRLRSAVSNDLSIFREDEPIVRIGMLYDNTKMEVLDHRTSQTVFAGKRLIRGFEIGLALLDTDTIAHLFLVHWPSRIVAQAKRERTSLGADLQRRIREIRDEYGPSIPIIAMGDFNDEPFDQSMSDALLGSRDRTLVRKKPELLYNPFWRWLGERQTLAEEGSVRLGAGTHYFRSDPLTQWFTFDQILVSASLLGGNGWVLCEESTGVWHPPPLFTGGRVSQDFDHLPIVVTLLQQPATGKET